MEAYLKAREDLIASEHSVRSGAERVKAAGDLEVRADKIVRAIRAREAKAIWRSEHEDYSAVFRKLSHLSALPNDPTQPTKFEDEFTVEHPEIVNFFPGMPFLTARGIIEKTLLYKIVDKMPKGGILHSHLDSTVDVDVLLKLALNQPGMHIRVPERVTAKNFKTQLPETLQMSPNHVSQHKSLSGDDYKSDEWVSFTEARENFSVQLGGPAGFDKWFRGIMKIDPNEAYREFNSHRKMWEKLRGAFVVSNGLLRSLPVFRQYIREYFRSSIDNGISYVEPRVNFVSRTFFDAEGDGTRPHREFVLMFKEVLDEIKAELKAQGREGDFVGAKIIYSTVKIITPEEMAWHYDDCIALKQEFPHLIAGFDLVGPEDFVKPLMVYMEGLLQFKQRILDLGLDLPFILHAGETLGDGDSTDNNLYDALLLDTKRLGHGFSLVKHPLLMDMCKKRGIPVEICPISNELLRLSASMPAHPMPILIAHGVEVVVSNDDPAAFGNLPGLSNDFYQVLVSSETTGLIDLGVIARRSLEVSMLEAERKQQALENFDARWSAFLQSICDSYGDSIASS